VPHEGARANGIAPCAVCRLSSSPTRGRCREGDSRGMRLVLLPVWIGGAAFRGGERKLGSGRRTIPSGSAVRRSALVGLRHPSRLRVAVECRKSISAVGPVRISRRPVHRGGDDRGRVRGGGGGGEGLSDDGTPCFTEAVPLFERGTPPGGPRKYVTWTTQHPTFPKLFHFLLAASSSGPRKHNT